MATDDKPVIVPERANPTGGIHDLRSRIEPLEGTKRLLTALKARDKEVARHRCLLCRTGAFSLGTSPCVGSVNPLRGKTTDWRAVCGKSACTVRRGEGPNSIGSSYPYQLSKPCPGTRRRNALVYPGSVAAIGDREQVSLDRRAELLQGQVVVVAAERGPRSRRRSPRCRRRCTRPAGCRGPSPSRKSLTRANGSVKQKRIKRPPQVDHVGEGERRLVDPLAGAEVVDQELDVLVQARPGGCRRSAPRPAPRPDARRSARRRPGGRAAPPAPPAPRPAAGDRRSGRGRPCRGGGSWTA